MNGTEIDPKKAPEKWTDYEWEMWVPKDLRKSIEEFWSDKMGRSPRDWLENWKTNTDIKYGQSVSLRELCDKRLIHGRYVHAWNNIGRLVDINGDTLCVACPPKYEEYKKAIKRSCTLCGERIFDKDYVVSGKHKVHIICYIRFTLEDYTDLLESRKRYAKILERDINKKIREELNGSRLPGVQAAPTA